jgi:asparagine synthase (glutamine-hydrolysing)
MRRPPSQTKTVLGRGLFEPAEIRRYVEQHIRGEFDHATQLWALLMLELWYRRFIDQK